ncbi:unnamed protein product [Protopolystoma xenopodis]|uniref:Uncharacterized protein n=1 Tax=Protopolystoma xenopodis TaxID=117903 RepID=A0A3S5C6X9_9PLAT|nr:unnamed protein product [Protopolystoma xenopodis]
MACENRQSRQHVFQTPDKDDLLANRNQASIKLLILHTQHQSHQLEQSTCDDTKTRKSAQTLRHRIAFEEELASLRAAQRESSRNGPKGTDPMVVWETTSKLQPHNQQQIDRRAYLERMDQEASGDSSRATVLANNSDSALSVPKDTVSCRYE